MILQFINKLINNFGLKIIFTKSQYPRKTIEDGCNHLKMLGYYPKWIMDIGVGEHTNDIYRPFKKAEFCLVEPVKKYSKNIQKIMNKINANYAPVAVGRSPGIKNF